MAKLNVASNIFKDAGKNATSWQIKIPKTNGNSTSPIRIQYQVCMEKLLVYMHIDQVVNNLL